MRRIIILWRRIQRISDGYWLDDDWNFTDDPELAGDYTYGRSDAFDTLSDIAAHSESGEGCRVMVRVRKTNRPKTTPGQRVVEYLHKASPNCFSRWEDVTAKWKAIWEAAAKAGARDRG